ncbi:MAG: ATP-binding protein [Coriobacteriales bacterium]|jgi:predicted AAA+ superfamily ATPase|nr:ATP-binding protein [Coriobacteriales bacterium]
MIKRERYLVKLRRYKNQPLIKVVTGIRRSGKSTLLEQYKNELLSNGVRERQVQFINFEDPDNSAYLEWPVLYERVKSRLSADEMNYLFLDEIQWVKDYERAVDGLAIRKNVDIYLTGSNAWFLSSDLATVLAGRYVEISILPFSFGEFVQTQETQVQNTAANLDSKLVDYMVYGSFPQAVALYNVEPAGVNEYLKSVFDTILMKDVIARKRIADPVALQAVVSYLFDNIGNITNSNAIANVLTSQGRKISYHTVDSYLEALIDSFIIYPASRYDVRGKKLLKTNRKYYIADTGLRQMLLGREKLADRGRILENVIYLELLRRGYKVWTGKNNSSEVDFICRNTEGYTEYYQVAYSVRDEATLQRELSGFDGIKDHNPKTLISLDPEEASYRGIRQVNAVNFLLGNATLP